MNTPYQTRLQLADTIEEIGQAMGLLREASDEFESANVAGAKLCASDALDIISSLEGTFSSLAADLAKWSEN